MFNRQGPVENFDKEKDCSWTIAWADKITGFDPKAIVIDKSRFRNPLAGGRDFSVGVSDDKGKLELRYGPAR